MACKLFQADITSEIMQRGLKYLSDKFPNDEYVFLCKIQLLLQKNQRVAAGELIDNSIFWLNHLI